MWHLSLFSFPFISLIKMCGGSKLYDRLLLVSIQYPFVSLFLTNRILKIFQGNVSN